MAPRAPGKTSSQVASGEIRPAQRQPMRRPGAAGSSSGKPSVDATNASGAKTSNTVARGLPLARPPADSARTKVPDVLSIPNYVAPRPLRQITPNTKLVEPDVISEVTKIEVELRINELGRVTEAHAVENGTTNNALTTVAVSAAREWVFEPAKVHGRSVPSDYAIVFRFHPSGQ
jgi:TonB family protein